MPLPGRHEVLILVFGVPAVGKPARVPVAQDVVDRLEHYPAGGNLRRVASVFAAAGDDALADGSYPWFAIALHRFDRSPADQGVAFFADVAAAHGLVRLVMPRGDPGPATQGGRVG